LKQILSCYESINLTRYATRIKEIESEAETSSAIVLFVTSHFGMPVSTTHVISGSIFGVGTSKRLSAVRWGVAQSLVMAWVLTLPAAGLVAALSYELLMLVGLGK
jgi:PiT family inorganic phosphate transporter